jgi:urease accessory protein
MRFLLSVPVLLCLVALADPAAAHPATGLAATGGGFAAGLAHPFSGLDHVLAMVAVGLWAVQLGGRAVWLVPAAFVAMMLVGGALGALGIALPAVELGIIGSVLLLGLMVALSLRLPVALGMALVGVFALCHGHAHGSEMPVATAAGLYALGFAAATAALHGLGLGLGLALRRGPALRWSGAGIAAAGLVLLLAA